MARPPFSFEGSLLRNTKDLARDSELGSGGVETQVKGRPLDKMQLLFKIVT